MSVSARSSPGGQPSTTQPSAGPWLSPKVVTLNSRPKVLPATLGPLARLVHGRELGGAEQEHFRLAAFELEPGEGRLGVGLLQRPAAVAHLHHQDAILGQ